MFVLLQAKTLQCATELIGVHAVDLVIVVMASGSLTLHFFASDADRGHAANELALTFCRKRRGRQQSWR